MKHFQILLLFVVSNSLFNLVYSLKSKSRRVNQFWTPKNTYKRRHYNGIATQPESNFMHFPMGPVPGYSQFVYHRSSDDESKDSYLPTNSPSAVTMSSSDSDSSDEMRATDDKKPAQIPQINFYNSVPNGIGFIGQGLLWLREIGNAVGTPLPMWIGSIPLFLIGIGLIFFPDLTNIGLPLFYPSGADGDPLAAFPPIAEITIPDIANSDFIQQAIKLLPPKLVSMKKGK